MVGRVKQSRQVQNTRFALGEQCELSLLHGSAHLCRSCIHHALKAGHKSMHVAVVHNQLQHEVPSMLHIRQIARHVKNSPV